MFFSQPLIEKSLQPVVEAVKKNKKVTFFLGAGISTSCGIPDFRSPDTGLYSNLQRLNLPYPEAVFDIDYFRDSPKAFYTLCDELYPGKFLPSKFHFLLALFQEKKLLQRIYTQNIDTLERLAGIKDEFIVEAHGSFAKNHCIDCGEEMDTEVLKQRMLDKTKNDGIPVCEKCKGYVKPDIVFFGEGLPEKFFYQWEEDSDNVDLAIVAGTSLTVMPFAGLPAQCSKKSTRVLINKEVVGDFKYSKRKSDIIMKQDCDSAAELLAKLLGWEKDLDRLYNEAKKKFTPTEHETAKEKAEEVAEEVKDAEKETDKKDTAEKETDKKDKKEESDLEKKLGKLSL